MGKDLKDLTKEELTKLGIDLRVEEARRRKEEEETIRKIRMIYWERLKNTLTLDVLDALFDHERTSCSNDNIANGLDSIRNGRNAPRCTKCALIELLNGSETPEEFVELAATLTIQMLTRTQD